MQHLQQQPHPRILPDLLQEPRSGHGIILASLEERLHPEIAEQSHQHAHELDLRELASRTVAGATGPAYEGTVAFGRLFELLCMKCRIGARDIFVRLSIRGYPSRRLEFERVLSPVAGMRV